MQSSTLGKTTSFLLLISLLIHLSTASPPPNPVSCTGANSDCTFTNAYGAFPDRSTCRASKVEYPSSEKDLISIVANAVKSNKKMKVVTRFAHSIPQLACPGGSDGILISTRNLDHVINVDKTSKQITVESGITLKDFIEAAANDGLALTHAPYWFGVTIGGLLSTGSHGSSLWGKGGAVHEYVVDMRLVTPASEEEGFAMVRSLQMGNLDLDAAKVSLGVLGVISQVTLQLEPMFKRNLTFTYPSYIPFYTLFYPTSNDLDLAERALELPYEHEFADIAWFPYQEMVVYRLDDRVSTDVQGDGAFDYIGFRANSKDIFIANRKGEELEETTKNDTLKCLHSYAAASAFIKTKYGLTNNGIPATSYPVVGFQNKMQSSGGCAFDNTTDIVDVPTLSCPWDSRIKGSFFHQTTVSVPLNSSKDFIKDMQKLRDKNPDAFCGVELYYGILMRYVKASSAYLGKPVDVLDVEISYYRSHDATTPRLYEDFMEEIEQMALIKYKGYPHWGKNRPIAFQDVIKKKYATNGPKFIEVMKRYDPKGLFSSEWSDKILGINGDATVFKDGCALEGLCICSEDSHCAPSQGYNCKPGKIYKEAMVCSPSS